MTERDETQVREGSPAAADVPAVTESQGTQAVAEGAEDAVAPQPAPGADAPASPPVAAATVDPDAGVATPAPPLDSTAATPDREEPSGQAHDSPGPAQAAADVADERPELLVGGAFVGGLVVAFVLKRAASG